MHESVPQLCGGQSPGAPALFWHRSSAAARRHLQLSHRELSGSAAATTERVCQSEPRRKSLWGFTAHTQQTQRGQLEERGAARDRAKDWRAGEPALGHPAKSIEQPEPAALGVRNSRAWAPREAEPAGAAT